MTYKNKYLKYKLKYLNLKKKLRGGASGETQSIEEQIKEAETLPPKLTTRS